SNPCLECPGERGIVVSFQEDGRPERHTGGTANRELPCLVQDAVETIQPDRNYRNSESGGDHGCSGLKPPDASVRRPAALREDQHRVSGGNQLTNISQRLPRTCFPLRKGERVEEQGGEVIVRAVTGPGLPAVLLGEEVRREELLGHRR